MHIRRRAALVISLSLLLFVGLCLPAHAFNPLAGLIKGVALAPILLTVAVVGYLAAIASSLLLSLGGLIAGVAYNIQTLIVSQPIVTIGWTIVRDIANLGFVLVIIFIAFATILRMEGYRSKELLPRLIAAAILVNFSLQIGASIIGFSQVFTDFFFTKISTNPLEIGSTMLGAFGPQRLWKGAEFEDIFTMEGITTLTQTAVNLVTGPWFMTIFNLIMFFVIVVLAFMLLIRFFQLSFLLIICPITWLFFVIPGLKSHFSKWWGHFFQWVFFAPAVSFFVYLSFTAAQWLANVPKGGVLAGEGIIENILTSGIEIILLSGFLISGIIAAQSMSITGAKGAMGFLGKVGAEVQGWAGRKGRQAGAAGFASKPVTAMAGLLQRTRPFGKWGMVLGAQSEVMRQRLIEDSGKRLSKYTPARLGMSLGVLTAPEKIYALEQLAKTDNMSLVKKKDNVKGSPTYGQYIESPIEEIRTENQDLFAKYSRQPQWKSVEVAAGTNVESANALRKGPVAAEEFNKAMKKWIEGLKPEHIAKLPINDIFTGDLKLSKLGITDEKTSTMYREGLLEGITSRVPGDLVKLFSKVKGVGFEDLQKAATKLQTKFKDIADDLSISETERKDADTRYKSITKALEGSVAARFYSGMYGGGGGTPPAPVS